MVGTLKLKRRMEELKTGETIVKREVETNLLGRRRGPLADDHDSEDEENGEAVKGKSPQKSTPAVRRRAIIASDDESHSTGRSSRTSTSTSGGTERQQGVDQNPTSSTSESDSDEEFYEVESIVDKKFEKGEGWMYLVKWAGWPDSDNSWVHQDDANCPDKIRAYEEKQRKLKQRTEAKAKSAKPKEKEVAEKQKMKPTSKPNRASPAVVSAHSATPSCSSETEKDGIMTLAYKVFCKRIRASNRWEGLTEAQIESDILRKWMEKNDQERSEFVRSAERSLQDRREQQKKRAVPSSSDTQVSSSVEATPLRSSTKSASDLALTRQASGGNPESTVAASKSPLKQKDSTGKEASKSPSKKKTSIERNQASAPFNLAGQSASDKSVARQVKRVPPVLRRKNSGLLNATDSQTVLQANAALANKAAPPTTQTGLFILGPQKRTLSPTKIVLTAGATESTNDKKTSSPTRAVVPAVKVTESSSDKTLRRQPPPLPLRKRKHDVENFKPKQVLDAQQKDVGTPNKKAKDASAQESGDEVVVSEVPIVEALEDISSMEICDVITMTENPEPPHANKVVAECSDAVTRKELVRPSEEVTLSEHLIGLEQTAAESVSCQREIGTTDLSISITTVPEVLGYSVTEHQKDIAEITTTAVEVPENSDDEVSSTCIQALEDDFTPVKLPEITPESPRKVIKASDVPESLESKKISDAPTATDANIVKTISEQLPEKTHTKPVCNARSSFFAKGMKLHRIHRIFGMSGKRMGICEFRNCTDLQIIPIDVVKQYAPMAVVRAYEELTNSAWQDLL